MSEFNAKFNDGEETNASFVDEEKPTAQFGETYIVESGDYEKIINHPYINDEEVVGRKSFEDYGVRTMTNLEIKELFDRVFNKGGE